MRRQRLSIGQAQPLSGVQLDPQQRPLHAGSLQHTLRTGRHILQMPFHQCIIRIKQRLTFRRIDHQRVGTLRQLHRRRKPGAAGTDAARIGYDLLKFIQCHCVSLTFSWHFHPQYRQSLHP